MCVCIILVFENVLKKLRRNITHTFFKCIFNCYKYNLYFLSVNLYTLNVRQYDTLNFSYCMIHVSKYVTTKLNYVCTYTCANFYQTEFISYISIFYQYTK